VEMVELSVVECLSEIKRKANYNSF
jgi:hypothetical protein